MTYDKLILNDFNERIVNEVDNYVDDLLRVSGISKEGTQQLVWVILHSHFSAIKMFEQLCDEDKKLIATKQKLLRNFFTVKCNLKEQKRKKRKESSSLQLFLKENNKKEKVQKTLSLAEREISTLDKGQQAFWEECQKYIGHPYDEQMIQAFFCYWAERVAKSGLMLWETKKSWNTCFRLAVWAKKSYYFEDKTASSRYNKTKEKLAKEAAISSRQQQISAYREQDSIRREEELRQAKESSVSLEQYLANHPDSNLRMFSKGEN